MKPISIAAASALALGLALSSLPAQAQKNTASASTPGGGGLSAGSNAVSPTVQTIQLFEIYQPAPKGGTAGTAAPKAKNWGILPSGTTFSGPVRMCLKYNSGTSQIGQVYNELMSALTSVLSEVKDRSGKSTYRLVPGDPVDDKINSQLCVFLNSF